MERLRNPVDKVIGFFKGTRHTETFAIPALENGQEDAEGESDRGQWGSRAEFVLSCVGLSVGIGNIWRFPYLAYKNGGAAFLIPYVILLLLIGKPIYFLELALGQFSSLSSIAVWKCCPIARGVGFAMQVVCFICCIYYNVIVAYTVFYTAASFTSKLPWTECAHWSDFKCYVRTADTLPVCADLELKKESNITPGITCDLLDFKRETASEQYWTRYVLHLHEADGIGSIGGVRWDLALCLLFAWIIVFICLCKGIKSSGKVVYVTATFPYIVLLILLIRGVTLDGAIVGLKYLFIPDWNKLLDVNVWKDAAEQMFFSLSISWGTLIMFGSYNPFRNKVHIDAFVVSLVDFATSLIGCVAVFSVLGYLSQRLDIDIASVATKGPGLTFVVYPEAIAMLPISPLWSFLFFMMLFTLGLDSEFALLEGVISNLYDFWPKLIKYKTWITLFACLICFGFGLSCAASGGQYVLNLMDTFGASQSVLLIALFEMIALMWIYGVRRIKTDFEFMLKKKLSYFWLVSWGFICPVFLAVIFILSTIYYEPISYGDYVYPDWAQGVGWLLEMASVLQIPLWAFIMTFKYWKKGDVWGVFRPTDDWGPSNAKIRREWKGLTSKVEGVENPAMNWSTHSIPTATEHEIQNSTRHSVSKF